MSYSGSWLPVQESWGVSSMLFQGAGERGFKLKMFQTPQTLQIEDGEWEQTQSKRLEAAWGPGGGLKGSVVNVDRARVGWESVDWSELLGMPEAEGLQNALKKGPRNRLTVLSAMSLYCLLRRKPPAWVGSRHQNYFQLQAWASGFWGHVSPLNVPRRTPTILIYTVSEGMKTNAERPQLEGSNLYAVLKHSVTYFRLLFWLPCLSALFQITEALLHLKTRARSRTAGAAPGGCSVDAEQVVLLPARSLLPGRQRLSRPGRWGVQKRQRPREEGIGILVPVSI